MAQKKIYDKEFKIQAVSRAFPSIRGAVIHSDRGSQYTSASYWAQLNRCGIFRRHLPKRIFDNDRSIIAYAKL